MMWLIILINTMVVMKFFLSNVEHTFLIQNRDTFSFTAVIGFWIFKKIQKKERKESTPEPVTSAMLLLISLRGNRLLGMKNFPIASTIYIHTTAKDWHMTINFIKWSISNLIYALVSGWENNGHYSKWHWNKSPGGFVHATHARSAWSLLLN